MTPSRGRRALDLRVLMDCSGSTSGAFDPTWGGGSVWDVSGRALEAALAGLGPDDAVTLWDFDDVVHRLGSASGPAAAGLVARRRRPGGGTEIGRAIAAAGVGDVLLVTDGLSHALDPQAAAATGARISALLVGAGSLDAAVGHAVALTGGTLAVVGGEGEGVAEAAAALVSLVADLRGLSDEVEPSGLAALPVSLATTRGGARIAAAWGEPGPSETGPEADASPWLASPWLDGTALARAGLAVDPVAAYAAGLALPRLAEAEARRVAVAHGLACHLTSLLVVDRDGDLQDGVPEQHKVALPQPRGTTDLTRAMPAPASAAARRAPSPAPGRASMMPRARVASPSASAAAGALAILAGAIDWDRCGAALFRGDLSSLGADATAVRGAAALPEVAAATRAGADAVAVVVALMARFGGTGRTAARVAARLASVAVAEHLEAAARALGLAR